MHSAFNGVGMSSTTLFAISCGDNIHDTFLSVWDQGMLKQIFLIIFMLCFFTAASNIFYALIQEGYDKSRLRKQLKISMEEKNIDDLDLLQNVDLTEFTGDRGAPEIQHYFDFGDLSESEKSISILIVKSLDCINLLYFNLDQAKIKIKELSLLRKKSDSSIALGN